MYFLTDLIDSFDAKFSIHKLKIRSGSCCSPNKYFTSLYEEARQKAGLRKDQSYKPERSTVAKLGWGASHKAPISKENLLLKPIIEIAKFLDDFKGADFWHGTFEGEPDKEGLAGILQGAVKEDPKKFTDHLNAFMDTDYFYLDRIFRGLKEAWDGGIDLDWKIVFDFCIGYLRKGENVIIDEARKVQGEDSGRGGRYIWIVEAIVELISSGSADDSRAFPPELFAEVEEIFDLIIPLLKGEKRPDTQRDALMYALNTTLGRTIM